MMHRFFFALAVAVVGVSAFERPAEAGITGAALTTPSSVITNPCPISVPFTGTISGSPGTKFTYSFNRFVNGVQQVAPGGAATMPASGSISVSDNVSFASSASGRTFDQIWVHNIAPSQADVYGNIVTVAVTCGAAPTPPPSSIVAPTNLKQTTDPGACGDHVAPLFGGIICGAALSNGNLVLIWDYKYPGSVDGFRIYQTNNGGPKQVDKQSGMTGKALDVKATDAKGNCYLVRAYKGSAESGNSNTVCVGGGANLSSLNLPITNTRYTYHYRIAENDAPYCGLRTNGTGGRYLEGSGWALLVGYSHSYDAGTQPLPCWQVVDYAYRSAVKFDLSPLSGRKIWKATLTMVVANGWTDFNHDNRVNVSCASQIMYATSDWSGAKDLIDGDPYLDMPNGTPNASANTGTVSISGGRNVSIDVTDAVRRWKIGQPNFGFVFRGPRENYPNSNEECASEYGNLNLRVDYFN